MPLCVRAAAGLFQLTEVIEMRARSLCVLGILAGFVTVAAAQDARVRVVHASPDAPAVDVLVENNPAFTNLAFSGVTSYASLPAGMYNVQVVPAGQPGPVVINANLALSSGTDYSVLAVNTLANIEPLVLVDDNTIARGQARVRFVHASPDAPAVDIALAGGPVLFANIAFREIGDYLTVPSGVYDLEARIAGTMNVALSVPGAFFARDTVYTVYAMGLVGGVPSLQAVVSVDAIPAPGAFTALAVGAAAFTRRARRRE